MHEGVAESVKAPLFWRCYFITLLAEVLGKAGKIEDALASLAEARHLVAGTGIGFYLAEFDRVEGELLLTRGPEHETEAEARIQKALDVARRQSAKSLELRALISLGRLYQGQGRREEAHAPEGRHPELRLRLAQFGVQLGAQAEGGRPAAPR